MQANKDVRSKQFKMRMDLSFFRSYAIIPLFAIFCCLIFINPVYAKQVSDFDITLAIEDELLGDDAIDANFIDVKSQQGVVTLTGTVNHILAKERAVKIVENIVGVRAVVNRINVKPVLSRNDAGLQKAVENALILDPAADSYEVTVTAENGFVTLNGTVDSWQERQLCETVSKGVSGVIDVTNNITAMYKSNRSDLEIKKEIEAMLKNDVRVDDNLIKVSVDNSKVTLSGTVGSLAEKNRATNDAYVAGVRTVNSVDLTVEWWARDKMRRQNAYVTRNDEQIEKAVKDAFRYDPRVFSFNPKVKVDNGKVILSGVVDNLYAKISAQQDARNVIGVWRVQNHIRIRPDIIPPDDVMEERVSNALQDNPWVDRFDIDTDAVSGWVYLSGSVSSFFEKREAERVAEGVKGVTRVINNITFPDIWNWKADKEIRDEVKSELFWSPFVDEDQVNVTVFNGVVTLNGNVETWGERKAAGDNAYEGGAKTVINNLTVTYRYHGPYDNQYLDFPYYW